MQRITNQNFRTIPAAQIQIHLSYGELEDAVLKM